MSKMNLVKAVDIAYMAPLVGSANNTTDTSTTFLDMANWDGAMFISFLGPTSTTGCVYTLQVFSWTAASAGGAVITGATATYTTVATNGNLGKCLVVDVYRPVRRYLYTYRTTTTQVGTFGECWAILYNGRVKPTTPTDSLATTFVVGA